MMAIGPEHALAQIAASLAFADAGGFRIAGGTTAPGDDAPLLLAGGLVLLGDVVLD